MVISSPLNFIHSELEKNISLVIDNFKPIFLFKDSRPNFNGRFIYFDMNRVYGNITLPQPERLMHILSLEPIKEYTIFPCNNDISFNHCINKCELSCANSNFKILNRSECYYRMARIHWIPEIINLANENNPNIKIWIKKKKSGNGKWIEKTFIRYQEGIVDYVIILRHVIKNGVFTNYYFESAFPVFLKRNKIQYDKEFKRYNSKKVEIK